MRGSIMKTSLLLGLLLLPLTLQAAEPDSSNTQDKNTDKKNEHVLLKSLPVAHLMKSCLYTGDVVLTKKASEKCPKIVRK